MSVALPYPNMDFTPLDILTAAEMDKMVANDQYLANFCAGLADGTNIGNGVIQAFNYSSDETIAGKWVDGKTIYRKVFEGTNIPPSFDMGITVDKVISAKMMFARDGDWMPAPYVFAKPSYTDYKWYAGFFIKNRKQLVFEFGEGIIVGVTQWHVVLEYTKTA